MLDGIVQRVGSSVFVQLAIEMWNGLFLLLIIFAIIIGKKLDKTATFMNNIKIPLTNEIIVFYIALFLYNLFDWLAVFSNGDTRETSLYIRRIAEFAYYAVGAFQTCFFLQFIKYNVAEYIGLKKLEK